MPQLNKIILSVIILAAIGCKQKTSTASLEELISKQVDSTSMSFPQKVELSTLTKTDFVPTLENDLAANKNSIYAPSFLLAWNEIKQMIKTPIEVTSSNSKDFKCINESESFKDVLDKGDYITEAQINDGAIVAKAFFKKLIPFDVKFDKFEQAILFQNKKVTAFGVEYYTDSQAESIEILYYSDDNHFVLKLIPQDKSQEIILAKGMKSNGNFTEILKETGQLISEGKSEKDSHVNSWKFTFTEVDQIAIPIIRFNIETNYKNLEGQHFSSNGKPHFIATAYQRTAFVFDEYGAGVESYSLALADSVGAVAHTVVPPQPQKLIFDKPFFIFIKQKKATYPYFAMKVANTELMEIK